jgi:hypothetical protein
MTTPGRRIIVFLGPSLRATEAGALVDAEYHPPAGQGDVYRVLAAGVDMIVLIDGVFHSTPSVWQRELLDALEDGITVLGGASMGAIRAAELEPFGMQGSGTVFRWYRDGVIEGDDEVALRHSDIDHDFRALSEPLVNIRATLVAAVSESCVDVATAGALLEEAKATYYPDRCYRQLLAGPVARGLSIDVWSRLADFFKSRSIDLKRADAIETLSCAAAIRARGDSQRRGHGPSSSANSLWADSRSLCAGFGSGGAVSGAELLRRARTDDELTAPVRGDAIVRCFVCELARSRGVWPPAEDIESMCGPRTRSDERWLAANGLTHAAHRRLLASRARHHWFLSHLDGASGSEAREASAALASHLTGRERELLLAWARTAGVAYPPHAGPTREPDGADDGFAGNGEGNAEEALLCWLLQAGPGHFGLPFNEDLAVLEELQITGAAARLADAGTAGAPISHERRLDRGD